MFSNIQEKLDNFDNSKRTKRGLINLVGTIGKQLFGLADDDDLRTINNHFNALSSNQKFIVNELNLHSSILRGLNTRWTFHFLKLIKTSENYQILSTRIRKDENVLN